MTVKYEPSYTFNDLERMRVQTGCGLDEARKHYRKLDLAAMLDRCQTIEDIKEYLREAAK